MNKVILMGRLAAKPDFTTSGRGKDAVAICRFTVAINYNEDKADFIRCAAFNRNAEAISEYMDKGSRILIDGRWATGSYENEDGDTIYTNECVVNRFEFCENAKTDDDSSEEKSTRNKNRRGGNRR